MAVTKNPPNIINLSGTLTDNVDDHIRCGVASTPGMLAELFDVSGENKWRPNASATEQPTLAVFLSSPESNLGVDDVYAINDLAPVWYLHPGYVFWGILRSGQNVANCGLVQSNGDGKLKAATATTATANVARFKCLDNPGLVSADTRIRVQVIC
jgi:hypothetical protein